MEDPPRSSWYKLGVQLAGVVVVIFFTTETYLITLENVDNLIQTFGNVNNFVQTPKDIVHYRLRQ